MQDLARLLEPHWIAVCGDVDIRVCEAANASHGPEILRAGNVKIWRAWIPGRRTWSNARFSCMKRTTTTRMSFQFHIVEGENNNIPCSTSCIVPVLAKPCTTFSAKRVEDRLSNRVMVLVLGWIDSYPVCFYASHPRTCVHHSETLLLAKFRMSVHTLSW